MTRWTMVGAACLVACGGSSSSVPETDAGYDAGPPGTVSPLGPVDAGVDASDASVDASGPDASDAAIPNCTGWCDAAGQSVAITDDGGTLYISPPGTSIRWLVNQTDWSFDPTAYRSVVYYSAELCAGSQYIAVADAPEDGLVFSVAGDPTPRVLTTRMPTTTQAMSFRTPEGACRPFNQTMPDMLDLAFTTTPVKPAAWYTAPLSKR